LHSPELKTFSKHRKIPRLHPQVNLSESAY